MEIHKVNFTISFYFEIKDAELYGGKGELGYAENKYDCEVEEFKGNIQESAKLAIRGMAGLLKVPEENVRIISRKEYEEKAED